MEFLLNFTDKLFSEKFFLSVEFIFILFAKLKNHDGMRISSLIT